MRASLAFAGCGTLLMALIAARDPVIRGIRRLPSIDRADEGLGAEASVRSIAAMDPC